MFHLVHNAKYLSKKDLPSRFEITNHHIPIHNQSIPTSNPLEQIIVREMLYHNPLLLFYTDKGIIYYFNTHTNSLKSIDRYSYPRRLAVSVGINTHRISLMVIYVNRTVNPNELKCEEIGLRKLLSSHNSPITDADYLSLFENEVFSSPSEIEFDDINKIILTKNSFGTYGIWSMQTYKPNFEINDRRIEEVRVAKEVFVTIKTTIFQEKILITLYTIDKGKMITQFDVDLIKHCPVIFLEVFHNVFFMKQERHIPLIINLITLECFFFEEDLSEEAYFIFINHNKTILLINDNEIRFYDLQGKMVKKIRNNKAIGMIMPNNYTVSSDKKYLATFWEINGQMEGGDMIRKQSISMTHSSFSMGSLSQSLNDERERDRKVFNCSLSSIEQHSQLSNDSRITEQHLLLQEHKINCLEIVSFEDPNSSPLAVINLKRNMEVAGLFFNASFMCIYLITIYGEIYTINL